MTLSHLCPSIKAPLPLGSFTVPLTSVTLYTVVVATYLYHFLTSTTPPRTLLVVLISTVIVFGILFVVPLF